jgi:hypothetical protein
LQVVAEFGAWQVDAGHGQVGAVEDGARRQVAGGDVDRLEALGALQDERASEDGDEDQQDSEREAAGSPGGGSQAFGGLGLDGKQRGWFGIGQGEHLLSGRRLIPRNRSGQTCLTWVSEIKLAIMKKRLSGFRQ